MTFVTANALFGVFEFCLQPGQIGDSNGLGFHAYKVLGLQTAQVARHQFPHRANL